MRLFIAKNGHSYPPFLTPDRKFNALYSWARSLRKRGMKRVLWGQDRAKVCRVFVRERRREDKKKNTVDT